jgi:hypothetical protein
MPGEELQGEAVFASVINQGQLDEISLNSDDDVVKNNHSSRCVMRYEILFSSCYADADDAAFS